MLIDFNGSLVYFTKLAEEAASRPLARSGSPGGRLPFIQCYIDDLIAISMKFDGRMVLFPQTLFTFPIHNIDTKFKLAITLEGSLLEQNKL